MNKLYFFLYQAYILGKCVTVFDGMLRHWPWRQPCAVLKQLSILLNITSSLELEIILRHWQTTSDGGWDGHEMWLALLRDRKCLQHFSRWSLKGEKQLEISEQRCVDDTTLNVTRGSDVFLSQVMGHSGQCHAVVSTVIQIGGFIKDGKYMELQRGCYIAERICFTRLVKYF
jgi:hypothetical protein